MGRSGENVESCLGCALYDLIRGVGTLADIIQILIQDAVFAWHIRYSNLSAKDCQSNPCSRFGLYFSDLDKLYSIYSNRWF